MKIKVSRRVYEAITNIQHLAAMGILFYIVGTAGLYENGTIDGKDFLIRTGLALILLFLG